MTYPGPQQPWHQPGHHPHNPNTPQRQPGYQPTLGAYGSSPAHGYQPGYPPGYPPPKKKSGLVVGLILGIVVLLVLGIGAFFIFKENDDKSAVPTTKPASKIDLLKLETACQFLTPEEVTARTEMPNLRAEEVPRSEPDLVSFIVGCRYLLPDNTPVELVLLQVFQPGTCDPQRCLDINKFQDAKPVEGIGQKALFYLDNELKRGQIRAVEIFGDIPVMLNLVGPGPNVTAQELSVLAKEIFAKIGA